MKNELVCYKSPEYIIVFFYPEDYNRYMSQKNNIHFMLTKKNKEVLIGNVFLYVRIMYLEYKKAQKAKNILQG